MISADRLTALALADTMLAGPGSLDHLTAACERVFGAAPPWTTEVCAALLERAGEHFHYFTRHEIAGILLQLLGRGVDEADDDGYEEELIVYHHLPSVQRYCIDPPLRPEKAPWLQPLGLPELPTSGDLAAWLSEPVSALQWLADQWRTGSAAQSRLQHYHYRWVAKRSGGLRLIEMPKQRLRRIQQQILRRILDLVPPHPAAHGFRRGHSCISHASAHAGQYAVIRMDLKDFFPSIRASRIHALFEKLDYPPSVAGMLARLCVNRVPNEVFRDQHGKPVVEFNQRQALKSAHLPQGSPCSPALANLCAFRLDVRLDSLARSLGATYSRYADDLAFSGGADFAGAAGRFHIQVAAIALEEGFRINTRKTRLMKSATRQQLTGLVVNAHPNIRRDDYDRLKATLTNCVRHGPASQNRGNHPDFRASLAGRISHVAAVNPHRAAKLQQLAQSIVWPA